MRPLPPTPFERAVGAWRGFWYGGVPPRTKWALLRIGVALVLLYVLFIRSFDLTSLFTVGGQVRPELLAALDRVALPFSVFDWVGAAWWLWTMHAVALLAAAALLAGVWTPVAAGLSLVFHLSYMHHNPLMVVGLDGLLSMALFYLMLVPSGGVLGVLARTPGSGPVRYSYAPGELWAPPPPDEVWANLPLRLLQLHLCALYLQSGLGKLTTDWLTGPAFWHPRLQALGVPLSAETLVSASWLPTLFTFGLVLFELAYPVLVWARPWRYPVLVAAVVVHLGVGLGWGHWPHNLLMLVLNMAFVPAAHLEWLYSRARPLLSLPWLSER